MARNLKDYAMRVVHLDGSPIDWENPPLATKRVMWSKRTMFGGIVTGSFRSICHLDRLNRLAYLKWGRGIIVIQSAYNKTIAASKGTHDLDACFDLWIDGVDPWEFQRFLRRNGFGCWVRKPPTFSWHLHGFSLPPPEGTNRSDDWSSHGFDVGVYVDGGYSTVGYRASSSQIEDYYNHAFGLSGMHTPGSDRTWYPNNIPGTVFNLRHYVVNRVKERNRRR